MRKLALHLSSAALILMGACDDDDDIDLGDLDDLDQVTFSIALSPGQEVPVCANANASAFGAATIIVDKEDGRITVETVSMGQLSSAVTAAHIHAGAFGVAGPIVFELGTDPASLSSRIFTAANYPSPPPAGAPQTFEAFVDQMLDDDTYVNIHTVNCPSGEIRGQLVVDVDD